jgi:D-alanyl-D-alanine carboxypeptidase
MDFKGEQRRNDTHESTTDPEAKLMKKGPGKEARLCFAGHATMENRHGLCVLFEVQPAVGAPESAVAVDQMIELRNRGFAPQTVGADKGYHTEEFVTGLRAQKIVPHPARKDGQKTLHVWLTLAHAISQKLRKRIEEIFGWTKTTGCFRKSRYRGVERTHAQGQYVVAAWNLVRMAKLLGGGPPQTVRA